MFKKTFLLFLILLVSICAVHSAFAAVTTKEGLKVLYITESYGANTTNSVEWRMSENILTKKLSPQYSLGTNGITQTTFSSASQALNTVENYLIKNVPFPAINSYISNIASYLKSNKITYAKVDWFYSFYDQGDNNTLKKVYLPLIIYPDGKLRNLGARVITTQPRILYYIYKSKATEDVPQSWGYSDGGKLYKYVLDSNFQTISFSTVDSGGKYDPPITPEGNSTIDPDSGLKLLINEVVTKEIEQYSALFAIVDYARQISPYYECDNQGNCNAVVSVESFTREINGGMCIIPVPSNYATGDIVYGCGGIYGPGFVCGEGNNVAIWIGKFCCCYVYCPNEFYCDKVCDCNYYPCDYFWEFMNLKILVPISGASFWGCLTTAQYRSGIPFFYVYDHATGSCICDRFTGRCFCSSGVYMRAWLGGFEWCHPIYTSTSYSSDAIWFGTWNKSYRDNYIQFFKKSDNSYRTTGRTGYTLQYNFERYYVEPNGNYVMTSQSVGYTTVGQNFDKKVILDRQYSAAELSDFVIDPFKTNQIYNFKNDTVNNLPCDRYIYNGSKCTQAPITTYTCQ